MAPHQASAEWLEKEYNPRASVKDIQKYFQNATKRSQAARGKLQGILDRPYGSAPKMTMDIFPASPGSPIHVFIHGGFWRARDKSDYTFLAETLVAHGITAVIANYSLCPAVRVSDIVDEMVALFTWVEENRKELGGGERIVASGHSAGAHLIAMAHDPTLARNLATGPVDHAILISGIYDLRPVTRISVNAEIGLTQQEADRMSPMRFPPPASLTMDVVVGGEESGSWIGQSRQFADVVSNGSRKVRCAVLEGHNHYSIMEELMRPDSWLTELMVDRSFAREGI